MRICPEETNSAFIITRETRPFNTANLVIFVSKSAESDKKYKIPLVC